ncbi:MAG: hypothetical protein KBG85_14845 [Micropruina sp.]|nr:hypothetical protein [Micropruina sp.]
MSETRLVEAGGVEFYVEISAADGAGPVGLEDRLNFDGVRDTIQAIAGQVAEVWQKVKPSEATVEFGLQVTAKSGKLTGLLVEGGAEASLKVSLTWKSAESK